MQLRILLACAILLPLPAIASTATLRSTAIVAGSIVKLSDLFDDAGSQAPRTLGPAPAPGQSFVVEAPQLAAIARQFGVGWTPLSAQDRIVVEREGQLVPRGLVLDTIRTALVKNGAPATADVELASFAEPMIGVAAQPTVDIEQFDYNADTGRFTAGLLIRAAGTDPIRVRVAGSVAEMLDVVVPRQRIAVGAVIRAEDLRSARARVAQVKDGIARLPDELVGHVARRPLVAGQPVSLADVARASDIAKGSQVMMEIAAAGLNVSAVGIAMESGVVGDRIRVMNSTSRAILEAEVLGVHRVRVDADSKPIVLPPASPYTPPQGFPANSSQVAFR